MLIGAGIASIFNVDGDGPKPTRSRFGCLGCFGLLIVLGLTGYGLKKSGCIPQGDDTKESIATTKNGPAKPVNNDSQLGAEKRGIIEKKMAEYWRKTNAELKTQETRLRTKYKAETEAANLEWRKRCEEREAIRLTGLSPEEYERRKKLYDEAVTREMEAGRRWSHLVNGVELQEKLIYLRNAVRAKAEAYREKLEKDLETPHPRATDARSRGIKFPISDTVLGTPMPCNIVSFLLVALRRPFSTFCWNHISTVATAAPEMPNEDSVLICRVVAVMRAATSMVETYVGSTSPLFDSICC